MQKIEKKITSLILIPARGGSKSIPRKNLALIGGKPLIEFTIQAALEANFYGRICLSTDNQEIRNFGLSFPIEAPFLRPKKLAKNNSSTVSVICHALDWYEINLNFTPDLVVLLQPTCPFRSVQNIQEAYKRIVNTEAESLISINPVNEHPCEYIVRKKESFSYVMEPPKKPGRQNFPEVFFINGAIYITRVPYIRKTGTLFDKNALLYVMSRHESLDIDEYEDLEYANWLYNQVKQKEKNQSCRLY